MQIQPVALMSEPVGFNRMMFPLILGNHHVDIITNEATLLVDGRLSFHFVLYCRHCQSEVSVRGRLPKEYSEVERIQTAKLIALGHYHKNEECPHDEDRKIYMQSA